MNEDYDDILLDFEIETKSCPVCAADAAELGGLGRLTWYRCTCCGTEFSKETEFSNDAEHAEGGTI